MATLLSTVEVAALLNVTETTIKRWTDQGTIACIKTVGGHRKFLLKEVIRFSEENGYPVTGTFAPAISKKQFETLEFCVQTANYGKISEIFLEELLHGDKRGMHEILVYLAKHHISFSVIGDEVIRPAMVRIGERWAEGKLEVNQEHLASQSVIEALIQLSPELHRKPSNGLTSVCACVEGDVHEIGLRILAYALESEGWAVHYVGPNTPFDTLHSFMKAVHPDLLCLSYTIPKAKKEFFEEMKKTGKLAHAQKSVFVVGGYFAGSRTAGDFNCDHIATSTRDAIAFLKDRFELKPGPKKKSSVAAR